MDAIFIMGGKFFHRMNAAIQIAFGRPKKSYASCICLPESTFEPSITNAVITAIEISSAA